MAELALGDFVELPFLDPDVLRAIYERCDLLLLTSDREGYGLPVLEAFAAGKPVVASDIPALRESSGGLATLVPAESLQEWVAAIEDVLAPAIPTGALAADRRAHAAARTWDDHVQGAAAGVCESCCGQQTNSTTSNSPTPKARATPNLQCASQLANQLDSRRDCHLVWALGVGSAFGSWELGVGS